MDAGVPTPENASMPPDQDTPAPTATRAPAVGALPLAEHRIDPVECSTAGFVGFAPAGPLDRAVRVESFEEFAGAFTDPARKRAGPFLLGAMLAHAVRGFFRNGGQACWVARADGEPGAAALAGHLGESGTADAGLRLLAGLDEVSAVGAPDAHGLTAGGEAAARVQRALVTACEGVLGRTALLDPPPGLTPGGALTWRGQLRIDSPAAAAYFPWLEVADPATGASTFVPPCGHAAGLWARVDSTAGPHRAPTAEALLAADGTATRVDSAEQHQLNRAGVNCLRAWPGPEPRVWGACTLSGDPALRYLHRQRTVGHLTASIAAGTRWAAGQPNDERLRGRLTATVTAFLTGWWRRGALQGDTPAQAFFVRCDATLNDAAVLAPGDLVIEIGLAVGRRSDFRVLRIIQRAGAPASD